MIKNMFNLKSVNKSSVAEAATKLATETAKGVVNNTIDVATSEVKAQYSFAKFVIKLWVILGSLLGLGLLTLVILGIKNSF